MRRRSRLLRIAKWGGTILCAVCVIGFELGGTPALRYVWTLPSGKGAGVWIAADGIGYASFVAIKLELVRGVFLLPTPNGWSLGFPLDDVPLFGTRAGTWGGRVWGASSMFFAIVIGVPTACLWLVDRRRPLPGHCPCGYDLTGNVSGVCPECGRKLPA